VAISLTKRPSKKCGYISRLRKRKGGSLGFSRHAFDEEAAYATYDCENDLLGHYISTSFPKIYGQGWD